MAALQRDFVRRRSSCELDSRLPNRTNNESHGVLCPEVVVVTPEREITTAGVHPSPVRECQRVDEQSKRVT